MAARDAERRCKDAIPKVIAPAVSASHITSGQSTAPRAVSEEISRPRSWKTPASPQATQRLDAYFVASYIICPLRPLPIPCNNFSGALNFKYLPRLNSAACGVSKIVGHTTHFNCQNTQFSSFLSSCLCCTPVQLGSVYCFILKKYINKIANYPPAVIRHKQLMKLRQSQSFIGKKDQYTAKSSGT